MSSYPFKNKALNNKQQLHIDTWLWTFYHQTGRERSVQGLVGHPADDFSSRGDTGGHGEVR